MKRVNKRGFPKAFISYSWEVRDYPDHHNWEMNLAKRLRAEEVNAQLERWIAQLGSQLPIVMEQAIRESDFVLMICTPVYKRKADPREGGVRYHNTFISSPYDFYSNRHN